VKYLSGKGIRLNQTLCFSAPQALLSAQGRVDLHQSVPGPARRHRCCGNGPIRDICEIYRNYGFKTQVLAALHPQPAARHRRGQGWRARLHDAVRRPATLLKHPLTDIGLKRFLEDWEKSGAKIWRPERAASSAVLIDARV
jgi:transaldolase